MKPTLLDFPDRRTVEAAASAWLIRLDGDEALFAETETGSVLLAPDPARNSAAARFLGRAFLTEWPCSLTAVSASRRTRRRARSAGAGRPVRGRRSRRCRPWSRDTSDANAYPWISSSAYGRRLARRYDRLHRQQRQHSADVPSPFEQTRLSVDTASAPDILAAGAKLTHGSTAGRSVYAATVAFKRRTAFAIHLREGVIW